MNATKSLSQILILFMCILYQAIYANGITYSFTGGRFGDNLESYCHARWLSYKHSLEFYYRPFRYSEMLVMHQTLKQFQDHTEKNEIPIETAKQISNHHDDVVYITDPFAADIHIDWDDQYFLDLVQNEILPVTPLPPIEIPQDHIGVALHVRRGGGYDFRLAQADILVSAEFIPQNPSDYKIQHSDHACPRRFPPDAYYIGQLKYIASLFPEKLIYAFLFTDDPQPDKIAAKYSEALNNPKISFDYRKNQNSPEARDALQSPSGLNVLDDFFAMMNFEYLIRAGSAYSEMAGNLGKVKMEIWPHDLRWEGNTLIITEVGITERKLLFNKWQSSRRFMLTEN